MSVMRASRLLLDTNVWFDYFMGEGRSLQTIQGLIEAGLDGRTDLLYVPTSAKDLFYLIPRRLRSTDGSRRRESVRVVSAGGMGVRRAHDGTGYGCPLVACGMRACPNAAFDVRRFRG